MSKTTSDLHFLIKSLTKNEKRFFKIFSTRHSTDKSEIQYAKLFDIYEKMDNYNHTQFSTLIHEQNIGNNIGHLKHQLYKQILKSLNIYNYEKSAEFKVHNLLINTQILFDKGLFKQARKTLDKARVISEKNDLPLLSIECYNKEKVIAREQFNKELLRSHSYELPQIELAALDRHKNFSELTQMRSTLMLSAILGDEDFDKNHTRKIKSFNNKLTTIENLPDTTFSIKDAGLIVKSLIAIYHKDTDKTLYHLQQRDLLYINYPQQIVNNPANYIALKYNLLVTYLKLKNYTESEKILITFNEFRLQKNIRLVDIKLFNYLNRELNYYNEKGDFHKTVSYEKQILDGLKKYGNSIHPLAKASLFIYLSIAFLSLKSYGRSDFWIKKVLEDLNLDNSSTQKETALIITFINAFEQKKYTYLNYLTKQLESESKILAFFINNNFKTLSKKEINMCLLNFKDELEETQLKLEDFDILSWVNAQLLNQSFEYLIKLKFNKGK